MPQFVDLMPVSLIYAHCRNLAKPAQVFMDWVSGVIKDHV